MQISVRYYTRSGNTEKLAKAIGKALNVQPENLNVPLDGFDIKTGEESYR